ncbi:MAG: hypothetical protein WBC04_09150 [Candidatus Acidiferrales bacterium]
MKASHLRELIAGQLKLLELRSTLSQPIDARSVASLLRAQAQLRDIEDS